MVKYNGLHGSGYHNHRSPNGFSCGDIDTNISKKCVVDHDGEIAYNCYVCAVRMGYLARKRLDGFCVRPRFQWKPLSH